MVMHSHICLLHTHTYADQLYVCKASLFAMMVLRINPADTHDGGSLQSGLTWINHLEEGGSRELQITHTRL